MATKKDEDILERIAEALRFEGVLKSTTGVSIFVEVRIPAHAIEGEKRS